MKLLCFKTLKAHRGAQRIWIESNRLNPLGFETGTPINALVTNHCMKITPARNRMKTHHVSSRRAAGGRRPIIDINSHQLLASISGYPEYKIKASYGQILVTPSIRAFHIKKSLERTAPFRIFEAFCGGGTLTQAFQENPDFQIVGGLEIEEDFADAWAKSHPEATLIQADIRKVSPLEIPPHDFFIMGVPCKDHSNMGRAKKNLAQKSESGRAGSLYAEALKIILHHMPRCVLVENVPNYGESLAGLALKKTLEEAGYHLHEQTLEPHRDWGEISNRRRWICIGCLHQKIEIQPPKLACPIPAGEFLDPPNDMLDQTDANRIAKTIEGLHRHNARHQALGHGFSLSTIKQTSTKIPTIPASYHKINTGPFVETKFGLRMLRLHEVEAIMGAKAHTDHYATGIRILGQGVQTRIFKTIGHQIAEALRNPQSHQEKTRETEQLSFF